MPSEISLEHEEEYPLKLSLPGYEKYKENIRRSKPGIEVILDRKNARWRDTICRRIPVLPTSMSLIFGFMSFIIYLAFMLFGGIEDFQMNIYNIIQFILFSALLGYLLIFNKYIINKCETIEGELDFTPEYEEHRKELNLKFNQMLSDFRGFYIIFLLVAIPFLSINYVNIDQMLFSNIYLNIYNFVLYFLMLYLLSSALWMLINISIMLDLIEKKPYRDYLEIDLFNADRIGGLSSIRNHIIKILLYYSIGISLAVLSYIDPAFLSTVLYEIICLVLLLLVGIIVVLWGLQSLQNLFQRKMIEDLDKINEEYSNQYKNLTRIICDSSEKDDALASVAKRMEALNKERAERERILNENGKRYGYSAAILAAIAFIMPIISLFEKMNEFGLVKTILKIFNIEF